MKKNHRLFFPMVLVIWCHHLLYIEGFYYQRQMLNSVKIWKIDEDNSRIESKLTIRDASRFAFTEDGMIANDIIIDTTYISESVIMSVLEPKVYNGHQIFY